MYNLKAIIMKKLLLIVLAITLGFLGFSQEEMPTVWSTDMGIKFIYSGTGLEVNDYS